MKRKTAVLLATIGLLTTLIIIFAANWYFSRTVTTESVDYVVTINDIPEKTQRYQNVDLNGTVMLETTLKSNMEVTIFLALNSTINEYHMSPLPDPLVFNPVGTCLTDSTGTWNFSYNNTEPAGTILNFKAGIKK